MEGLQREKSYDVARGIGIVSFAVGKRRAMDIFFRGSWPASCWCW